MTRVNWKGATRNQAVGNFKQLSFEGHTVLIETENAFIHIYKYSENIVRFRIRKIDQEFSGFSYAVVQQASKNEGFRIEDAEEKLSLYTANLHIQIAKFPLRITVFNSKGEVLSADDEAFGTSWLANEVTTYKQLQPGERFIGLGEKTGNLDRRGASYVNWNTDHFAYPADADPIYMSTPFYMGILENRCYGIFFDNSHKTTFSFGCSNNRFSYFQAEDGEMDYYIINGNNVKEILFEYTWLTGRIELPPLWSLGFQQCRYSYYPYTEVLNAARTFREKNIPADVLYLDIHYMDAYKVFTWHPERFPDPSTLMKQLKEMGFHVVVILDPGIKTQEGYHAYDEGKSKELFVKYPDGQEYNGQVWPGWSAFPDFTDERARKWWAEKMNVLTDSGVEGFWNDMNEPAAWGQHLPDLIEFNYEGEGATHKKARNVYGMQMARSTFEGARNLLNGRRPFVLTRAGYCGIQRYAAAWTGDNISTDEHMLAGVRLINSMGLTGIPFAGYDVGGFAGEASPELFARWIALGAFSPFFRSHSMVNSRDSEPWSFGEEVEDVSRNFITLRYRLMPYIYSTFFEASQSGLPVNRSLAIDYTFDDKIYQNPYQNQYLFGASILICPIESNTLYHKLYFPEGKWFRLYDDISYSGKAESIEEYTKEIIPVFVKTGGILVMQNAVQSLQKEKPNHCLEIHLYLGADGEFIWYEDDGSSYAYQKGSFSKRVIRLTESACEIDAQEGNFSSHFQNVKMYLHGLESSITSLNCNGTRIDLNYETYRFIEPVSDFDPYHVPPKAPLQIEALACFEMELNRDFLSINW